MIKLTEYETNYIQNILKAYLVKNDIKGAVDRAIHDRESNVISFLLENGIDVFENRDIVDKFMFSMSAIESIEIPEGIIEIQERAFYGCSQLTSIKLPSTLSKIRREAFKGCSSLLQLYIPESVTVIGNNCFELCDNIELTTPKRGAGKLKLRIPSNEVEWYKEHLKTIGEQPNETDAEKETIE